VIGHCPLRREFSFHPATKLLALPNRNFEAARALAPTLLPTGAEGGAPLPG